MSERIKVTADYPPTPDNVTIFDIKDICIKVSNHSQEQVALAFLSGISGIFYDKNSFVNGFQHDCCHVRAMYGEYVYLTTHVQPADIVFQFGDICKIIPFLAKTEEVELNDKYTAKVGEKTIEVGCQSFPIEVIDKLVEARDKIRLRKSNG